MMLLVGCGASDWQFEVWGEDLIEEGLPSRAFADRCAATFDRFVVVVSEVALADGGRAPVATLDDARAWDLVAPGPHAMGSARAPAGHYGAVRAAIGPADRVVRGNTDIDPGGASPCGTDL